MKGLQTTKLHEVAFLSNTIIRSPLYLSNVEARLFALALGCLHQKEDSLEFSVHFNDVTATSRNGGSQYTVLHEARARLTQPLITQGKSKGKRRSDAIPLFTIITLDEGTSLVTGQFNPILKEYLLGLAGKFTTVELESLLTLKSAHSQRLFWILRSYHNQTWQEPISFDQLREWLFGENSDVYPLWNDFNRYVLKPALLEFQAIGWAVDVMVEKRGRRTDALLFKMTNTNSSTETPELGKSKKALTLSEIAEFRELLVTKYKELPALYDRLRLDFELKEYQAREVVNNITDLTTYQLVTKVLYEVRLALSVS
jgi:plasmid replication initiation protein